MRTERNSSPRMTQSAVDIESGETPSPGPQSQREICGMPAGKLAKRICIAGGVATAILSATGAVAAGILVPRAKNKLPDVKLKDILREGNETIFYQNGVDDYRLGITPFHASFAAMAEKSGDSAADLFGENSQGTLTVSLSKPRSDTGDSSELVPKKNVIVNQKHLKQYIHDQFSGQKNYSTLPIDSGLPREVVRTAMAQRLSETSGNLAEGFIKVKKMNTRDSLQALTGHEVEEFGLVRCGKPTVEDCHDEAYVKIAAALNRNDPVVITTGELDHSQIGVSVASDTSYPVYNVHPRGSLEGNTYSPEKSTGISVQTDPTTVGGESFAWLGTKMDQLGNSLVSIGHVDHQNPAPELISTTPDLSPEPEVSSESELSPEPSPPEAFVVKFPSP
jgi:hypothetical protein